jgi:hypothetical protein
MLFMCQRDNHQPKPNKMNTLNQKIRAGGYTSELDPTLRQNPLLVSMLHLAHFGDGVC